MDTVIDVLQLERIALPTQADGDFGMTNKLPAFMHASGKLKKPVLETPMTRDNLKEEG